MMHYKILEDEDRVELERKVVDALKDGWSLVGGVAFDTRVCGQFNIGHYCQAMTREDRAYMLCATE